MNITQDHYKQWRAETKLMLTNKLQLSIVTVKRSSGRLVTMASCGWRNGSFIEHVIYQDYTSTVSSSMPKRVTRKAVEEQHLNVNIESLIAEASKFYQLEEHTIDFDVI